VLRDSFFFSANKYKRAENTIEKNFRQIEQKLGDKGNDKILFKCERKEFCNGMEALLGHRKAEDTL